MDESTLNVLIACLLTLTILTVGMWVIVRVWANSPRRKVHKSSKKVVEPADTGIIKVVPNPNRTDRLKNIPPGTNI